MEKNQFGEFDLIDLIDIPILNPESVLVGIGDDCAVLPYKDGLYQLASCDLLVEDIHFLRNHITPYQLGYKAVAVNLSDIAAMGGIPTHILLSVALPPNYTVTDWKELYQGVGDICKRYHVNLIGGDTTASSDKLIVNVTVLGLVQAEHLHLRKDAKPGDKVFVTGALGGSRAGLELVLHPNNAIAEELRTALLQCHHQPEPCCNEIAVLNKIAGTQLHALNDISDGLSSECYEIADASHCAIVLFADTIPIYHEAAQLAESLNVNAIDWVLSGGEDYQLIGTMDGESAEEICALYRAKTGNQITIIGSVVEGNGVYLQSTEAKKSAVVLDECLCIVKKGYDHFADVGTVSKNDTADEVMRLLSSQIAILNKQIEEQNAYRHDWNNHLGCLLGLLECGDSFGAKSYLQNLLQCVPQLTKHYHNRTVLNVLCNQKAVIAATHGIEFQFSSSSDTDLLANLSDYDLCTLVANLLDNGIEHNGDEDCYLYLDLFSDDAGNTVLRMENSCNKEPVLQHGVLVSCKADVSVHGKGMEQIRCITEKYHGTFSWIYDATEGRFLTQCVFKNAEL